MLALILMIGMIINCIEEGFNSHKNLQELNKKIKTMIDLLFSLLGDLNPNAVMTAQEQEDDSYTSYIDVTECDTDNKEEEK